MLYKDFESVRRAKTRSLLSYRISMRLIAVALVFISHCHARLSFHSSNSLSSRHHAPIPQPQSQLCGGATTTTTTFPSNSLSSRHHAPILPQPQSQSQLFVLRGGATTTTTFPSKTKTIISNNFFLIPPPFRFFLSGSIGNLIFFKIDSALSRVFAKFLPWVTSSMPSFFVSYMAQIPIQHLLNALLVFGLETIRRELYWKSLGMCYSAYFLAVIATTVINGFLREHLGLSDGKAFIYSVYGVGVCNFFLLSAIDKKSKSKKGGKSSS